MKKRNYIILACCCVVLFFNSCGSDEELRRDQIKRTIKPVQLESDTEKNETGQKGVKQESADTEPPAIVSDNPQEEATPSHADVCPGGHDGPCPGMPKDNANTPNLREAAPRPVEVPASYSELFKQYVEDRKNGKTSKIPDYSYAGYHRFEKPVPEVTPDSHRYFDVTEYGAVPDDQKSDRDAVLHALLAAHKHGGPSVVFFPPGNFRLFEKEDFGKAPIEITRSNIVIKGSGVDQTQLEFVESHLPARGLISFRSSSQKADYWRGDQSLPVDIIRQVDVYSVEVDDAATLEEGMRINLNPTVDPDSPALKEFFKPHKVPQGIFDRAQRKGGKLTDTFELHEVVEIDGNVVTFGEPIHLDFSIYDHFTVYRIDHTIEECGIEDLSLRGGWRGLFKHHNGTRYGEDYRMIEMDRVFNSWIRRLRITDYSFAIKFWLTGYNTISDVLLESNPGHLSIVSQSSYGNFFAYVREQNDTHHGLGVSRSGVNSVYYRCVQFESMEAHCGYPRATLYDMNEGGFKPRGGGATFFPMHDKGLTFWNWNVTRPGRFDFWPEGKRYGYFLLPVIVGLHGEPFEIPDKDTDLLAYESIGEKVEPESLFDEQLKHRLGQIPQWLTTASQAFEDVSRHSRIFISEPQNQSVESGQTRIKLRLKSGMDPSHVKSIELFTSNQSYWDGFKSMGEVSVRDLEKRIQFPHEGAWILKAKMTNSRGEISFSDPVTVYSGRSSRLKQVDVTEFAMIPSREKNKMYKDFVKKGGAEAARLPNSKVLKGLKSGESLYKVEAEYREELHQFYRSYGESEFKNLLDEKSAAVLFDDELDIPSRKVFGSQDTLVQVQLKSEQMINRMDIHWKSSVPEKGVRMELQTSSDAGAWHSFVNDDQLWEFSVARIGSTLIHESLPGEDKVTSIYFPKRRAKYVRLLMTGFPNDVTEIEFYGPK
ncbi:MAG: DUF4955 domain-containing protein [Verrucomicrobiota bacterium]